MTRMLLLIFVCAVLVSCSDSSDTSTSPIQTTAQVTFIEIGATTCEPCINMQPIMQSLAERYGSEQLSVIFIDVFQDPKAAEPFQIAIMPTQVFLDQDGVEFHRHEGFYPEASIDSLLATRGLAPL